MSEHPFGERPVPVTVPARIAAIVALVRRRDATRADSGLELFVVRRARELRMFGGFVALLGGGVDPSDGDANDPDAIVACAARELFEEAGVLAVTGAASISAEDRDHERRTLCQRGADSAGFQRFLDARGTKIDKARFLAAGRWVTPRFVPGRFDAHIFVVEALPGEEPRVWPGELTSGEWIDPAALVAQWEKGEVLLHPPQSHLARTLAGWNAAQKGSTPGASRAEALAALCRAIATGGSRDDEQVATRIDFQRGFVMFPVVTPTLPPAQHTNAYVVGTGEIVVVDPGSPYPDEQARLHQTIDELRAEGAKPRAVLLTHHHEDHIGGALALARHLGVPIRAHARTLDRLAPDPRVRRETIEDGAEIELDGPVPIRLRAVFTPGHARGHLCFHEARSGALLAGDMVSTLSTIIIDPPEGDLGDYLASLERLRALAPRTLYPAHGLPTQHALEKLDEYILHRRARAEALLAALGTGARDLTDLVAEVYADVPAIVHPLAARSALASLEWLASQGRVRAAGSGGDATSRWALV
jgi:glyoxylase-like metal-dependent hydrolase (beta-lactamase superfamily II)/8-oxo-dGTP pyrophosphatase MutT (NUDIX family)